MRVLIGILKFLCYILVVGMEYALTFLLAIVTYIKKGFEH